MNVWECLTYILVAFFLAIAVICIFTIRYNVIELERENEKLKEDLHKARVRKMKKEKESK